MENNTDNTNETDSGFIINQLPFKHANSPIEVGLSSQDETHGKRIDYRLLPENIQAMFPECTPANNRIYIQFNAITFPVKVTIDLKNHTDLARIYYTCKLHSYFIGQKSYYAKNYVDQLEIWDPLDNGEKLINFNKYSLKVEIGNGTAWPAIRVCYAGSSAILRKNLLELSRQHPGTIDSVTRVIYNKRITSLKRLSPQGLQNRDKVFPLLNLQLGHLLGLKKPMVLDLKKFRTHTENIESFTQKYLLTAEMQEVFAFQPTWKALDSRGVFRIKKPEVEFVFANNRKHKEPHTGLLQYGPYQPIATQQIKIFFLYHSSEKEYRNQLASHLSAKMTSRGLMHYTWAPITCDEGLDVVYTDREDPLLEIKRQIDRLPLDAGTGYLGLYLSPYDQWNQEDQKHRYYYHIKEALLQRGVASQTIDRDKFRRAGAAFKWWLPNIAMAAIAKLGGTPWILDKPISAGNDLVVGFGLYNTLKYNMKVVGSSICFTDNGKFEAYDFFPESEAFQLAAQLEKALLKYLRHHKSIDRLVIHYYKEISHQAFRPIQEMINRLSPGLPVVIVNIHSNKTDLHLIQNTKDLDGLPLNGSYFHLGDQQYVLYINDHHEQAIKSKTLPLPIQLGLQCSVPELLDDPEVVAHLIEQVHSFSFLHWRSIRQPATPVTVAFPKMLASQMVWFDRKVDVEGASGIPWFL